MKIVDQMAHFFASELKIEHLFAVSGANIEDFLISVSKNTSINITMAKHEQSAANMAQGYYLATRQIGVVCSTSGGGAFNLLPSLAEARSSRIPLLAIIGDVNAQMEGKGVFQDSSGIYNSPYLDECIKGAAIVAHRFCKLGNITKVLNTLINEAITQKGPVVLILPKEVQNIECQSCIDRNCGQFIKRSPGRKNIKNTIKPFQEIKNLKTTCDLFFKDIEIPPLVVVGDNQFNFHLREKINDLINIWNAKIAVTPNGKSFIDHNTPGFLGGIGLMGNNDVDSYLQQTGHVIFLGTSISLLESMGAQNILPEKKILSIHEGPHFLTDLSTNQDNFLNNWFFINSSVDGVFSLLKEYPLTHIKNINFRPQKTINQDSNLFKRYFDILNQNLESNIDIICDAGNVGSAGIHYLNTSGKQLFMVALGMGGMGYSFGTGIGSCLASKNRTWIFAGDGSFYMHGMEIHTALEKGLPITFFIFNNNSHGMCEMREQKLHQYSTGVNVFKKSCISEGLAKMFPNLYAAEINSPNDLQKEFEIINHLPGTHCLTINIPMEITPPFRPLMD